MRTFCLNRTEFNDWVYEHLTDYKSRMEVYYGGAGSGKSYGAMQKMLLKALNNRRKVLVVRKVKATLQHSVFELLTELLMESGFYRYAKIRRSEESITLANGSQFLFKGMDDPEKVKSITGLTDMVIEEATELEKEDFLQLNLRLRSREADPQIYLMFNPVSRENWVYDYFFEQKRENCRIIKTNYRDNRFLPPEYVAELKRLERTNPAYYRIYALGEFATLDKLVFPMVQKRLIAPDELEGLPFFGGVDFGYVNDPTAIVWGRYDAENRRILITGEYFGTGLLNRQIAEVIKALGLQKEIFTADSSERKSIDEIRAEGVTRMRPAKKGKNSVIYGISWLSSHTMILDERCKELAGEFENYTWKRGKGRGSYINEPVDCYNHGIDALRYGLEHRMGHRGLSVWKNEVEI